MFFMLSFLMQLSAMYRSVPKIGRLPLTDPRLGIYTYTMTKIIDMPNTSGSQCCVIIECDEEWLILASKIFENAQSFLALFLGERIRIKELSVWLFQRPQKLTIFLRERVKNRQLFDLIFLIFQILQTVLIKAYLGSRLIKALISGMPSP